MTAESIAVFTFRDLKSFRDLADKLVAKNPEQFPDRSAVYRKGLHLLLQTVGLWSNSRENAVYGPSERRGDETAIAEAFGDEDEKT